MISKSERLSRIQIAARLGGKDLTPAGRKKVLQGLSVHIGKCKICRSTDRRRIERDFINYMSKAQIQRKWHLPNKESLDCHLNFFPGLVQKRANNRKGVFQAIVDRGMEVLPDENITAGHILEANSQIARMEGLFQDSLQLSATKISEKAAQFSGWTAEQIQSHRAKILEQLAFPDRQVFAPVVTEENRWGEGQEPGLLGDGSQDLPIEAEVGDSEVEADAFEAEDEDEGCQENGESQSNILDKSNFLDPGGESLTAFAGEEDSEERLIPGTHAGPRPGRPRGSKAKK